MTSTEDERFAGIVLERKFCSKEQLEACRTMQAQDPDPAALGDILRFNGVITEEQYAAVESALKAPAEPKPAPKPAAPATKAVTTACIMCDTVFDAAPDAGGRVRCPDCSTSFVPK